MGNPRPRQRGSMRIGRKHLHQPSQAIKDRRIAGLRKAHKIKQARWAAYHRAVAEYWRGEREFFPEPPPDLSKECAADRRRKWRKPKP